MKKLTLLLILLVSVLLLSACSSKQSPIDGDLDDADIFLDAELEDEMLNDILDEPEYVDPSEFNHDVTCLDLGGTWIESANECEGVTRSDCDSMFGTFNECASACRNDPEAQVCTMQCVFVCELSS